MFKFKLASFILTVLVIFSVFSVYTASAGSSSSEDGWVYWSDPISQVIKRTSLDGLTTELVFSAVDGAFEPKSLAIDFNEKELYWTGQLSFQDNVIRKGNLDGTGSAQTLVTQEGGFVMSQIALDKEEDRMFWVIPVSPTGAIYSSHLDGSDVEEVYFGVTPTSIALDLENDKMYYATIPFVSCQSEAKIQRANYDGSNPEDILTGLKYVRSIAINPINGDFYWSEGCDADVIKRITAEGDIDTIVAGELATSLSLDLSTEKLYWINPNTDTIRKANLDGTDVETFLTPSGVLSIAGLAILPNFAPEDLNDDDIVNGFDLAILLGAWTPSS